MSITDHELEQHTGLTRRELDVQSWRLEQLQRFGFNYETALLLTDARHVDLHDAERMTKQGCPPDLAARILL